MKNTPALFTQKPRNETELKMAIMLALHQVGKQNLRFTVTEYTRPHFAQLVAERSDGEQVSVVDFYLWWGKDRGGSKKNKTRCDADFTLCSIDLDTGDMIGGEGVITADLGAQFVADGQMLVNRQWAQLLPIVVAFVAEMDVEAVAAALQ